MFKRAKSKTFFRSPGSSQNGASRLSLEHLESRWNPSSLSGGIVQGNLYGDQSVVLALPIAGASGTATQIQLIETGDTGMAGQSVNTFVPFAGYQGAVNMAVGDFLNKGYQQLIVSASGNVHSHVKIFDMYQTFVNNANSQTPSQGTFSNPVTLQSFIAFDKAFKGGAAVAAGDFNADGVDDLAVGAGAGAAPHVRIYGNGNPATQIGSFYAFSDKKFTGGVSLAAGHLNGDPVADLIVGAGKGGGSRVVSYSGSSIISNPNNPSIQNSYFAFGTGGVNAPVQVQLIESIVAPEAGPVSGVGANSLTGLFTPTNNAPLVNGTIAAYNPVSSNGTVGLYSLVSGTPVQSSVTLPNTTPGSSNSFQISMAPVGYMFDATISNYAAPMVLVANPVNSSVSLYPLAAGATTPSTPAPLVQSVPNIFASPVVGDNPPAYNLNAFPFGGGAGTQLLAGVKTINSNLTNGVAGGTSGTLPSRQVAYQSPFQLNFTNSTDNLFSDFSNSPWNTPTNQTNQAFANNGWYPSTTTGTWGPNMEGPPPSDPSFPLPSLLTNSSNPTIPANFFQERMVAGALQIMNLGFYYQHHHMPAWFQPQNGQSLSQIISQYGAYTLTPAGMQAPGLDCSDYTNFITDFALGFTIPTGVSAQGTTSNGATQWTNSTEHGINLQGTSNIYINNDPAQGLLNSTNLTNYYTANGAQATYQMLNNTLQTGDFLYYGGGTATDGAQHVTMWVGNVGSTNSVPTIMDSHGSGVQAGVDSNGYPIGVVAPSGPQIRPWFVPPSQSDGSGGYEWMQPAGATPESNSYISSSNPNYYYFFNFSHVVRLNLSSIVPQSA